MIPADTLFRYCGDYRNLATKWRRRLNCAAEGGGGTSAFRQNVTAKADGVSSDQERASVTLSMTGEKLARKFHPLRNRPFV
jgi:hypothetical protein